MLRRAGGKRQARRTDGGLSGHSWIWTCWSARKTHCGRVLAAPATTLSLSVYFEMILKRSRFEYARPTTIR